jgi:hypothetical protein
VESVQDNELLTKSCLVCIYPIQKQVEPRRGCRWESSTSPMPTMPATIADLMSCLFFINLMSTKVYPTGTSAVSHWGYGLPSRTRHMSAGCLCMRPRNRPPTDSREASLQPVANFKISTRPNAEVGDIQSSACDRVAPLLAEGIEGIDPV